VARPRIIYWPNSVLLFTNKMVVRWQCLSNICLTHTVCHQKAALQLSETVCVCDRTRGLRWGRENVFRQSVCSLIHAYIHRHMQLLQMPLHKFMYKCRGTLSGRSLAVMVAIMGVHYWDRYIARSANLSVWLYQASS